MYLFMLCREHSVTSVVSPAQSVEPESKQDETSDRPNLRDILQNKWLIFFKNGSCELQRIMNCFRLKKSKKDMTTECNGRTILNSYYKGFIGTTDDTSIRSAD